MSNATKIKIGVSFDIELLERVDAVCAAKDEPRSNLIERAVRLNIEAEEQFVRDMENPLIRTMAKLLVSNPTVAQMINKTSGDFTDEQLEHIVRELPRQIERGKERAAGKKKGTGVVGTPATA